VHSAWILARLAVTHGEAADLTVLSVATEWSSGHGGLSTFNRLMCTALATAGVRVICMVPRADRAEEDDAIGSGVRLVRAPRGPGDSDEDALRNWPELAPDDEPDVIIGHGRITGRAALALQTHRSPRPARVHVIHMSPEEIEPFKNSDGRNRVELAEQRRKLEVQLSQNADLVFAVGERLRQRFERDLARRQRGVLNLEPGFDHPEFDPQSSPARKPPGEPLMVLLIGRAEDPELKGLDIAARGFAEAIKYRREQEPRAELIIRGVPPGSDLPNRIREWTGRPRLAMHLRPYTNALGDIVDDLHSATLVVMPSRAEGYGLTGVEALVAGTPLLVGSNSGLADFLNRGPSSSISADFVVYVPGDDPDEVNAWSKAIGRILHDPAAAFQAADRARRVLATEQPWSKTATTLLHRLYSISPRRAQVSTRPAIAEASADVIDFPSGRALTQPVSPHGPLDCSKPCARHKSKRRTGRRSPSRPRSLPTSSDSYKLRAQPEIPRSTN
jgi:glycosyltransferase involved in cell wall biosynthesis